MFDSELVKDSGLRLKSSVSYDAPSSPDVDNNGFISKAELTELFRAANLALPGYRVREIVQELTQTSEQLTFDEFTQVSSQVKGLVSPFRSCMKSGTPGTRFLCSTFRSSTA